MTEEYKELRERIYKASDQLNKLHNEMIYLARFINAQCKHENPDRVKTMFGFNNSKRNCCLDCDKEWV